MGRLGVHFSDDADDTAQLQTQYTTTVPTLADVAVEYSQSGDEYIDGTAAFTMTVTDSNDLLVANQRVVFVRLRGGVSTGFSQINLPRTSPDNVYATTLTFSDADWNVGDHWRAVVTLSGTNGTSRQLAATPWRLVSAAPQQPEPDPPALPNVASISGMVGDSLDITLPASTQGTAPFTYSITGSLAPGISFVASTRRLHGTYTAGFNGAVVYHVTDDTT